MEALQARHFKPPVNSRTLIPVFFTTHFSHSSTILFFLSLSWVFSFIAFTSTGSSSVKSPRARRRGTGSKPVSSNVFRHEVPEGRLHYIGCHGKIKTGRKSSDRFVSSCFLSLSPRVAEIFSWNLGPNFGLKKVLLRFCHVSGGNN